MQNVNIDRVKVNPAGLDAELRAALGAVVKGISVSGGQVIVHLDDGATQAQIDQARGVVDAHDESRLTPAQQAQLDLEAEREGYALPLDPLVISLEDLARRMAWLEKEVRAARGI